MSYLVSVNYINELSLIIIHIICHDIGYAISHVVYHDYGHVILFVMLRQFYILYISL